jgi:hypothetical protein
MSDAATKPQTTTVALEFHPLANIFPLMSDAELKVLAKDIRDNGLRQKITIHENKILDGRNRYRACEIAVRRPDYEELPAGQDPVAFVISGNVTRRQLNETQRGLVAARLANMQRGGKEANPSIGGIAPISQAEAAKLLNVSTKTVERSVKLLKEADPKLVTAAELGKVKVSAALRFVEQPEDEKQKLLGKRGGDVVKAVRDLKGGSNGGGGNPSDLYDAAETDLLAKLKAIENADTAEAAAQHTITGLVALISVKKPKFTLKVMA